MIKILKSIALLFAFIISIKCTKEEVFVREYPRVRTLSISESSGEYYFNADFLTRGDSEITNYGFVWGTNENPITEIDSVINYTGNIKNITFSAKIPEELKKANKYNVRSFVITNDYKVYGTNITFINP